MADVVRPAKPAFREKGYVSGQTASGAPGWSQWEQFEQVPDL